MSRSRRRFAQTQNACKTYAFALPSALLPSRGSSSRRSGHADDPDGLGFRRLFRLEGFAFGGVARALRLDEGFLLPDTLLVVLVEALFGNPLVPPNREQSLASVSPRRLELHASSTDATALVQYPCRVLRHPGQRNERKTHVCFHPL